MRVVHLIAGAGGMYCGSCMRDNRLAATFRAQGKDVLLVPLYTPIRTDEQDVSSPRVFYGGINVYLRHKSALLSKLPRFVNRVLSAPALLRGLSKFAGATRPADLGALTVSVLQGSEGAQRKELDELLVALRMMKPDLIHLPNLMFAGIAKPLKEALGVPLVCTLAGEDIFMDALTEPHRSRAFDLIARGSEDIDGFVAPTEYYRSHAAEHFKLPANRIQLARMGIHPIDTPTTAIRRDGPFTIGYLARICPEKGFRALCDAFIELRRQGRNCRLKAAGYCGPVDRKFFRQCVGALAKAGFEGDFDYAGEVTRAEKIAFLHSLDAFSVPTSYHEAKGFYLLEALACGVPVAQPAHGAFPEFLHASKGGLLYDPTDADGLANVLAKLMDDGELRSRLGSAARQIIRDSFTHDATARDTWAYYEQLIARAKESSC
jgi:glycosyltransferase involved in cell wall biosynthesis